MNEEYQRKSAHFTEKDLEQGKSECCNARVLITESNQYGHCLLKCSQCNDGITYFLMKKNNENTRF